MPQFGAKSLAQLATCHPDLQKILRAAIPHVDFTVLEGKRSEEQQRRNVEKKVSKTMESKHVYPLDGPSRAVDVAPYPLDWPDFTQLKAIAKADVFAAIYKEIKDMCRFYRLIGYLEAVAQQQGVAIRVGIDWDGDGDIHDQTFDDAPHIELR